MPIGISDATEQIAPIRFNNLFVSISPLLALSDFLEIYSYLNVVVPVVRTSLRMPGRKQQFMIRKLLVTMW